MSALGKVRIGERAPDFECDGVVSGKIQKISLSDYTSSGQWLILLFIPAAFSFVCPTEVLAFQNSLDDFYDRNCGVAFMSVDTKHSLWHWQNVPKNYGGLGMVDVPLLSDASHQIGRDYGVLIEKEGICMRGMFIIDHGGIVQQMTVNNHTVGRSVVEAMRLLEAFQAVAKHGVLCPVDWKPSSDTTEAIKDISNTMLESYEDRLANLQAEFGVSDAHPPSHSPSTRRDTKPIVDYAPPPSTRAQTGPNEHVSPHTRRQSTRPAYPRQPSTEQAFAVHQFSNDRPHPRRQTFVSRPSPPVEDSGARKYSFGSPVNARNQAHQTRNLGKEPANVPPAAWKSQRGGHLIIEPHMQSLQEDTNGSSGDPSAPKRPNTPIPISHPHPLLSPRIDDQRTSFLGPDMFTPMPTINPYIHSEDVTTPLPYRPSPSTRPSTMNAMVASASSSDLPSRPASKNSNASGSEYSVKEESIAEAQEPLEGGAGNAAHTRLQAKFRQLSSGLISPMARVEGGGGRDGARTSERVGGMGDYFVAGEGGGA